MSVPLFCLEMHISNVFFSKHIYKSYLFIIIYWTIVAYCLYILYFYSCMERFWSHCLTLRVTAYAGFHMLVSRRTPVIYLFLRQVYKSYLSVLI